MRPGSRLRIISSRFDDSKTKPGAAKVKGELEKVASGTLSCHSLQCPGLIRQLRFPEVYETRRLSPPAPEACRSGMRS